MHRQPINERPHYVRPPTTSPPASLSLSLGLEIAAALNLAPIPDETLTNIVAFHSPQSDLGCFPAYQPAGRKASDGDCKQHPWR